ncbi:MAG TPA: hypothetical protein VHV82_13675 [Sporichthyaceae bacterium]|jgi:hypothetical protein|nr:hypothetical protein [Sporichthyaceae bacterium]
MRITINRASGAPLTAAALATALAPAAAESTIAEPNRVAALNPTLQSADDNWTQFSGSQGHGAHDPYGGYRSRPR